MKLDSLTFKHDGKHLVGLGCALSKNCRSPIYEGRLAKQCKNKPITIDLNKLQITKVALKVSLEVGEGADVYYGIRVYHDSYAIIDEEFDKTKNAEWEYQSIGKGQEVVGIHGYIYN